MKGSQLCRYTVIKKEEFVQSGSEWSDELRVAAGETELVRSCRLDSCDTNLHSLLNTVEHRHGKGSPVARDVRDRRSHLGKFWCKQVILSKDF